MIKEALHQIVSYPVIYDALQNLLGYPQICERLKPHFDQFENHSVLDVGAGTGAIASRLPGGTRYLWMDADALKLKGFQSKSPASSPAVLADATRMCLKDKSIDFAFCGALVHHLDGGQLARFFPALAKVIRKKLLLFEPIETPSRISRLLWEYDRGSFPRREEEIIASIESGFQIVHREIFSVVHHYLLCLAVPKNET